jgi:maltose/maltodextrin transport system substrate-binding protein
MKTGKGGDMADMKTGKGGAAMLVPTDLIRFFARIEKILGRDTYRKTHQAALAWLMENPMRTFDWPGQCEDLTYYTPYRNHMSIGPMTLAMYLFEHQGENEAYRGQAEELLRFAEDQFVVWEQPFPETNVSGGGTTQFPPTNKPRYTWRVSCGVMEQYLGYYPIDACAAYLVGAYQRAYLATGNSLYLAKATTLANAVTLAQDPKTGYFPSYWVTNVGSWWLACAACSTRDLYNFARMTAEKR